MKLIKRCSTLLSISLFAIGLNSALAASNANPSDQIPVQDIQRFANVIAEIKQYYIEPVDNKVLFDNAIRGMLSNLDPHSSYLDANDLRDLQTVTTGEFGGIGIEVMPDDGFIKVVSPLDDTPASKAGIKAGDIIIRIDGKLVKDMTAEQAINMIRGKKGTKVTLTLVRKGKPLTVDLTREVVKVQSVKSKLLEPGYGYVRIAFFQENAGKDVAKAVDDLKAQSGGKLNGLILDLRNDPGGLLDSAISVADDFLDSNKLKGSKNIVYTKGRISGADMQAKATPGDIIPGVPMVVLINQGSASASEIVAGALQDYKRAIILGTKSFGKGSVQTVIPIDNQSAIKLTTALYYTPAGRSIQAKGITPDVTVKPLKIDKGQDNDIIPLDEADLAGHLANGNAEKTDSNIESAKAASEQNLSQTEKQLAQDDYQVYSALTLLKGLHATQ